MSIDLEKSIEKLIKGEELGASGGDDDEKEDGESFSALDLTKIREEMINWEAKISDISKIPDLK